MLDEAIRIIQKLLRVTYGEGWNYSLDVKKEAQDFLKKYEEVQNGKVDIN